jgi:hypothetical protein
LIEKKSELFRGERLERQHVAKAMGHIRTLGPAGEK